MRLSSKFTLIFVYLVFLGSGVGMVQADGPSDNLPDQVRRIPQLGIDVPDAQRQQLQAELKALEVDLAELAKSPNETIQRRLPDVQVYYRAVRDALRYQEFFSPKQIDQAFGLLETARRRASLLADNPAVDWTTTSNNGLLVRGYRSKLDHSAQPYGLVLPKDFSTAAGKPLRLDVWFHGRGETLSELAFIVDRETNQGVFRPDGTIVLHPYGRYSNAFKFAGEVDVLESIDHVCQEYNIDPGRISVRGFSMGGAACWQFATHYADRWFAANPGAGFAETPEFLRSFQKESLNPTWFEEKLWRMYDCNLWAANLLHCPTVAYSGEDDIQKQAADIMEAALQQHGVDLVHVIGPQTGHRYHPDAAAEVERRLDGLAQHASATVPKTVNLTTYTLKYNRMHWLTVDHLQQHWDAAHVTATIGNQMVDIRANNVTQLSLAFDSGQWPGRMDDQVTIRINGQRVTSVKPRSDLSLHITLHQTADQWRAGWLPDGGIRKRHNLQGPIDDALMDSFIFVRPTGKAANTSVAVWANQEMERAIEHWRRHFRGDVRIKNDVDITDDDIANANLILWGEPANNSVMQRVAEQLPIQWDHSAITVGSRKYSSQQHGLIAIYPNPLNPDRYVVLNSSFTFRDFAYLNNARQVPKLPDWAVVDIRTEPNSLWPGKIVDANFFGEQWELIESNLPDPHVTMSALRSFWTSQTVTESLFFIQEEDYLPPQARLFYRPQQVLKLTDAARQTEFIEGQDYEVDLDAGVIRLTKESRIPFKTYDQLYPLLESDSPKIPAARHDEKRGIFWGEGSLYHGLQTEVTYQKAAQQPLDSQWSANEVPTFDPTALPRTLQKLRQQQPLRIHLMGDSISEGYNASGFTGAKPHQPPYGQLVADALAHTYNVRINFQNFARAGWVSAQGVAQVQRERVAVDQPDLVIIAFGMNDVGQKNAAAYQNHLRQMIQQVRQTSPDTEFIIVSSMLGNAAWRLPMEMFAPLNEKLHELREPGIAVVDMTSIWHRLLRRKTFYDMTGNGVNHPNDFGHRLYAQAILAKLIDPMILSQTNSTNPLESLSEAKRVVFLGDSITYAGDYIGFWETWLAANVVGSYPEIINVGLPSETVSGLSEDGHAGGKFPRPHLAERLDRVLAATKPDVVVACYGMNCGIYLPLDQDRFQSYQDGMLQLKEKVEATGAKLIVITPPTFDDVRANKDFSYDAVLAEYAHWLVSKRSDGWTVIDFHNRMLDQLAANRLQDAEFTFQPDAVHPNRSGHWFVAQQLIRWCGDPLPGAVDASPEAMLDRLGVSPELLDLIRQRQMVRRDAYLTAAGHLRPGIANGLPVAEAEAEAAELTRKIEALRTTTSP